MCDVHLVPDIDEVRVASAPVVCGECEKLIPAGEKFRFIAGPLDDGSGERYQYRAHEECHEWSKLDVGEDGCFQYGGAEAEDGSRVQAG